MSNTAPSSQTPEPHVARVNDSGVVLDNVRLVRGRTQVFDGLTLHLHEPRIGLIGDNGAGKSSLFRLICGLEQAQGGRVQLGSPSSVGMMFQNPDEQIIFPTVEEELGLSLQASGLTRQAARAHAREWLKARGLGDWAERAIGSLSQGQRQHVCWLALLIASHDVLLLDEPFSSLDLPGQARLDHEIAKAPQQVIVSTHVLRHIRHFERVIWLDLGAVRCDGPAHEVCAAYEADVAARSLNAA
ncbi:ABC transporter [Limnohabitans sp. JirII-29]|uniref:energy-coupling factor ABC transporter ATP-binding protein n=1 Tax=Limnohabitans sp. JirII-29 TaxID=1835756 RepID=UPI000D38F812|nr:ABC transporter ATP-binding protein [Limnohabitans sp. JirII-29]PUE29245.1 ABC transporter [Limnohabitans sp. JirII-29]